MTRSLMMTRSTSGLPVSSFSNSPPFLLLPLVNGQSYYLYPSLMLGLVFILLVLVLSLIMLLPW
jgi:hypothetical protein